MNTLIRVIRNALVKSLVKRFGFRVYMQGGDWDGVSHYTMSAADAIEWMACYPANTQKFVFDRRGKVVAYQWAYTRSR